MYKSIALKYTFDELNPIIDKKTMEVHYNDLYKKYLNRLNKALEKNNYDFRYTKEELVNHIDEFPIADRDDILYNLGGVLNHERYFEILTPNKQEPIGSFKEKITDTYGSYSNFKTKFLEKASYLAGSGYTNLVLDRNENFNIINTSNQELPDIYGMKPIITIDLWEHAYFLKYYSDRNMYINQILDYLDYSKINERYEEIKKNTL